MSDEYVGTLVLAGDRTVGFRIVKHRRYRKHKKWCAWFTRYFGANQSTLTLGYFADAGEALGALKRRFRPVRGGVSWKRGKALSA